MHLCDIGNTSYHFFNDGVEYKKDVKTFTPSTMKEKIYYICVNSNVNEQLKDLKNWVNLASFIDKSNYYETMGVDRIVACEAIKNGVIIDAGSAITIDVVKNSTFMGGFIYPGFKAMEETYKNISPSLAYSFNFDLDLAIMPKNSQDAISYGFLKTLFCEVNSYDMQIILTGGDAPILQKIFKSAKVDQNLIFSGMKKIITKANIC